VGLLATPLPSPRRVGVPGQRQGHRDPVRALAKPGLLVHGADAEAIKARAASLSMDGEVVIHRANVAFFQVLPE
jgi:hypothetical protein